MTTSDARAGETVIGSDGSARVSDTFVDALGRCHIAGQEVPQVVYERHQRLWFDCAALITRFWPYMAFPRTHADKPLDPPLTAEQADLLNQAMEVTGYAWPTE